MTDKPETPEHFVTVIGTNGSENCECGYANFTKNSFKEAVKYAKSWRDEVRADERTKLLAEVEGWLVDEKLTVVAHKYGTETGEIESTVGDGEEEWKIPRNELRKELRAKLAKMKEGKQ